MIDTGKLRSDSLRISEYYIIRDFGMFDPLEGSRISFTLRICKKTCARRSEE